MKEGDGVLILTYRYRKWPPIVLFVPNCTLKLALRDKEVYHALIHELPRGLLMDVEVNHNRFKIRRV